MRIIVDGDNCSSLPIIISLAKEKNIKVLVFCDYNHLIKCEYATIIYNDEGFNRTDLVIYNNLEKDDILITNDVGLAGLALIKCRCVITNYGKIYNSKNINNALLMRNDIQRLRHKKKKVKTQRLNEHNNFATSLAKEINKGERLCMLEKEMHT